MPVRNNIDLEVATEIKRDLWEAVLGQRAIAAKHCINQSNVSRIKEGINWAEAPWPDGSKGAMPRKRWQEIKLERLQLPEHEKRQRIVDRVEEELRRLREAEKESFDAELRRILRAK